MDTKLASQAMKLHEAGWSNVAIGKKLGRHNSNISRLLKKMSNKSVNDGMEQSITSSKDFDVKKKICKKNSEESRFLSETKADNADVAALRKEIARLREELGDALLERDLYKEIINVAEKKFDISITKKAGTKQ